MIRLLKLEWLKLKNYKVFIRLGAIYFILLFLILSIVKIILGWLESTGAEFQGISPNIIPFYDFPDVWQNLAYLASYLKYFLAFIVIISICNEYSFRTMRQNIIDGLSNKDFLLSKELMIIFASLLNMVILFLGGTIMGLIYTDPFEAHLYVTGMEFLLAHFLELVTFLNIAMFLSLLMKKSGFAIIVLCFYGIFVEPIAGGLLEYFTDAHWAVELLPIRAINNLVEIPFQRYIFMEIQNYVSLTSAAIVVFWLAIMLFVNYQLISKRDVA